MDIHVAKYMHKQTFDHILQLVIYNSSVLQFAGSSLCFTPWLVVVKTGPLWVYMEFIQCSVWHTCTKHCFVWMHSYLNCVHLQKSWHRFWILPIVLCGLVVFLTGKICTCCTQSENLCNLKIVLHIPRILRLGSNLKIAQLLCAIFRLRVHT